jgi:inner membrane protein
LQTALIYRVASILFLVLLLLIPLGMIQGVVSDRQHLQTQVETTIANSFAGSQRVIGPVLVIPYIEHETQITVNDKGREVKHVKEHSRQIFIVPELLHFDGSAEIDTKQKGLYKALVYQTKGIWRARFDVPANLGLTISPNVITAGRAYLAFGVSDLRGLRGTPKITWEGLAVRVANGTKFAAIAEVGDVHSLDAKSFEVTVNMDLAGTSTLAFTPIGKTTTVELRAAWPHPNFGGRFLPVSKTIDDKSFTARWEVSHLASKNEAILRDGSKEQRALESFEVAFIEPVNIYQQAERAVKYGVLFVGLTFAAFFLFETLKNLRIHPLQYGLVGLAIAVFFLLLISLSEHLSFLLAYLIASAACISLIGFYLTHVLGGWQRGAAFAVKLTLLYIVLYGLLLSEDNALMLGSLLLFAVLAAFMVLTRRVDWYQLGGNKAAANPAGK